MNQVRNTFDISVRNELLEKIDLRNLFYPLWMNKWLIVLITSLMLFLGYLYTRTLTPFYSSNVLLQLEERGNMLSWEKDFAASSFFGGRNSSSIGVQTALIKTRYILEPVIQRLGLDIVISSLSKDGKINKNAEKVNGRTLQLAQFVVPEGQENKHFTLTAIDNTHYELSDALTNQPLLQGEVGKLYKTNVPEKGQFTIQVNRLNVEKSAEFDIVKIPIQQKVNELAKQINVNDLSQDLQLANTVGILKISLVGPDAQEVINILNTVAQVVVEKSGEKKSLEATKTLEFINQQVPSVKKNLDLAESALSAYLAKHGMIDLNSESRLLLTNMAQTQKNLSLLKMNIGALLQKYTAEHPFIISMKQKQLLLEDELKSLQKQLSQLPSRDQKVLSLMRDVKVKNQLYLVMLHKIQALQITKGGTISDISLLSVATLPNHALPNGALMILLFSLLLGFGLGASIIYIQQLWNRKITDPAIIEQEFNLPNLAIIPYTDKQAKSLKKTQRDNVVPLLAQIDPKNLAIEALRSFRTSVQFAMLEGKNNIITISGVSPGVGKSFVSMNFAFLQADGGKKILLIDGDIRKGHLKDYFEKGQELGLTEVICGACTFEEALITSTYPNLDFLATGKYPPNPSELLMSNRFKDLLETVANKYDIVVIDTPPILAVTDAAIIARNAGANFLVLASDTHEVKEVELALKRLNSNGVNVNGIVFNFSKKQKGLYRKANTPNYQYQYEYK